MLSLRPFHALSLGAAFLAMPAAAADPAVSGATFLVKLTRDGLADGVDTLVFEEKVVLSRIPDALFIGAVKIKTKADGDSFAFEGKAKCVQGGKGRLAGSIRGTSIAGSLACSGDESYTMEFQGVQVARVAAGNSADEPRYTVTPAGPAPDAPVVTAPASAPVAIPAASAPASTSTAAEALEAPPPSLVPAVQPAPPADAAGGADSLGAGHEDAAPASPAAPAATEAVLPERGEDSAQAAAPDADQRGNVAGKVEPAVPAE